MSSPKSQLVSVSLENGDSTIVIRRDTCPSCFGGGRVMGGAIGGGQRATEGSNVGVGWCIPCAGTGQECDEDFAYRVDSFRKSLAGRRAA